VAKNGFKILDSDMHVMEPPDLWQEYTDPAFRDRAPIGKQDFVRDLRLVHADGTAWGMPPDPPQPIGSAGKQFRNDHVRYGEHQHRGWTNQVQLEAMEVEGIDVAVLYPTRGLHTLALKLEREVAAAVAWAYNDWLYDFCSIDPSRMIGVGMVSPFDMDDAAAETRRCVTELGFRGIFLRANIVNGRNWHDPYYEPLWSVCEELDVPVGFHESAGSAVRQSGDNFVPNFSLYHVYSHPFEQMLALGAICAGGVLERHPKLRVAFLEGNASWLPWLLWRLDEHAEMFGDIWSPELTMAPSEYFKRQCYVSVDSEEHTVRYAIDYLGGSDNIVYSTDYPHVDAKFPHSADTFFELPISDEDKRKILWDNCANLYAMAVAV
jgi:predicted TIM-barrel fold metal-dependent hydrolase